MPLYRVAAICEGKHLHSTLVDASNRFAAVVKAKAQPVVFRVEQPVTYEASIAEEDRDIYRIIVPVGTNEHDIEWETMEILVGNYDDAFDAAEAIGGTYVIEFYEGHTSTWQAA